GWDGDYGHSRCSRASWRVLRRFAMRSWYANKTCGAARVSVHKRWSAKRARRSDRRSRWPRRVRSEPTSRGAWVIIRRAPPEPSKVGLKAASKEPRAVGQRRDKDLKVVDVASRDRVLLLTTVTSA